MPLGSWQSRDLALALSTSVKRYGGSRIGLGCDQAGPRVRFVEASLVRGWHGHKQATTMCRRHKHNKAHVCACD